MVEIQVSRWRHRHLLRFITVRLPTRARAVPSRAQFHNSPGRPPASVRFPVPVWYNDRIPPPGDRRRCPPSDLASCSSSPARRPPSRHCRNSTATATRSRPGPTAGSARPNSGPPATGSPFHPTAVPLSGRTATASSVSGTARTGSLIQVRPLPGPADRTFLDRAVSADGRTLAVSRGKTIDLIDLPSGRLLGTHQPKPHDSVLPPGRVGLPPLAPVPGRPWAPGRRRSEAGSPGRARRAPDPLGHDDGHRVVLAEDESGIVALAFAPDGKRAVSSGGSPRRTPGCGTRRPGRTSGRCRITTPKSVGSPRTANT